jgi:hypothetical protein
MKNHNRLVRLLLAAAIIAPCWSIRTPTAHAARKAAAEFQCAGIGRGQHKKGMTQAECRKMGGTVERGDTEKDPAPQRATSAPERSRRSRTSQTDEPAQSREQLPAGANFSCRGIGTGHHYKGMTQADCKRMGGTVEPAR